MEEEHNLKSRGQSKKMTTIRLRLSRSVNWASPRNYVIIPLANANTLSRKFIWSAANYIERSAEECHVTTATAEAFGLLPKAVCLVS